MNYAVIENGKVANVIVAGENFTLDGVHLVQSDTASPGDTFVNNEFIRPTPPPPPKEILNLAIKQQLQANDASITRAICEGDTTRIQAHLASQDELRKQLIP